MGYPKNSSVSPGVFKGPLCTDGGTSWWSRINEPQSLSAHCSLPVDQLGSGRSVSGTSAREKIFPSWVNLTLARQGQDFGLKNVVGVAMSASFGFIGSMFIDDFRDAFVYNSAESTKVTVKRFFATFAHVYLWFQEPISTNPVNNAFLASLEKVRRTHRGVAVKATKHGYPLIKPSAYENSPTDDILWSAIESDLNNSDIPLSGRLYPESYNQHGFTPIPVNQFGQSAVLFALIGYAIMNPAQYFIHETSNEDLTAYLHLWAIITHGLGIEDEFNICLQPDLHSARIYFQKFQDTYFTPALFNIDKKTKVYVEASFKGINNYIPGANFRAIMHRYLRDVVKIQTPNLDAILTNSDKVLGQTLDNLAGPITRSRIFQRKSSAAFGASIQAAVLAYYGPHFTNMEKGRYIYTKARFACPEIMEKSHLAEIWWKKYLRKMCQKWKDSHSQISRDGLRGKSASPWFHSRRIDD